MSIKQRWNNFKLWLKYPFIRPRTLSYKNTYCSNFFSYTYLDLLPKGWRKSFGINFCKDLKNALSKIPRAERNRFRILDLKEKWGALQVSCNWYTKEIDDVIHKYELISRKTCIYCGHKAKWLSKGWILPFCNSCMKKSKDTMKFMSIYSKRKKHAKNKLFQYSTILDRKV